MKSVIPFHRIKCQCPAIFYILQITLMSIFHCLSGQFSERQTVYIKMSVKQRKVALMGFRSVGKSSLAIQFVQVICVHSVPHIH